MRVVVTGGAGQLGSLVLRRLIEDRTVTAVRCLDVRPPLVAGSKLDYLESDVRDPDIGAYLEGFDALVHLAAIRRENDPELARSVNVDGSRNILESAVQAGIRRIVFGSSVAAYGLVHDHELPLTEDSPRRYQPDFTYAATKYEAEAFLDGFERQHPELSVIRLRPSVMVGMRMEHPIGDRFRRRIVMDSEGSPIPVVWDEDVADAVMLSLKSQDGLRGAFNLSADEPLAPHEVARVAHLHLVRVPRALVVATARIHPFLAWLTGQQPPMDPAWVRTSNVPMVVSCARARDVLGWNPVAPSAREVWKRFAESVPYRTDGRILFFSASVNLAARRRAALALMGHNAWIHLALTGVNGGDFTLAVHDGRLRMYRGIPRPPTAVVEMPAMFFLDLLSGKKDFSAARTTGRVRVEGDEQGTATNLLRGLIESFRGTTVDRDGRSSRLLGTWMARRA